MDPSASQLPNSGTYLLESFTKKSTKNPPPGRLLCEFAASVEEVETHEADFRRFVGENRDSSTPGKYHDRPIKMSCKHYGLDKEFKRPVAPSPRRGGVRHRRYKGGFPYGAFFVGVTVRFESPPPLRGPLLSQLKMYPPFLREKAISVV